MKKRGGALKTIGTAVAALVLLFLTYQIYLSGQFVVAAIFLGTAALGFLVYTTRSTYTHRYLFPGVAGIVIFVVFPLVYTVWIGTTNYSSKNLLTFERATIALLGEVTQREGSGFEFTLHRDGEGFRIVLRSREAEGGAPPEGAGEPTDAGTATAPPPPEPTKPRAFVTPALPLVAAIPSTVQVIPLNADLGDPLPLKDVIARREAIRAVTVRLPDGILASMSTLREFATYGPLYRTNPDLSLTNVNTGERLTPNFKTGFYQTPSGENVQPGFRVDVGLGNYVRIFTDPRFRGPFFQIFLWTVVFAAGSVFFTFVLGMILAEILGWESLRFRGVYRILLFLPYAVPGFISILVFRGLFNRNFGEINLILDSLFGIRPNWLGHATLAKITLLIVNTWLGFPYYMLICMGLQKSIPHDLYEASAIAGAGPLTNFFKITWPLIRKPISPLLVSTFAFNFNNFVLIFLLTRGRPDFLNTNVPAGETDILVSYTYRIAFEDSGTNFGLAAAISTMIFVMVAILSVVNLKLTKANVEEKR